MAEAQAAGQGSIGIGRATQLGSLVYLVLGVGLWVTFFITMTIASDQSILGTTFGSGDELFVAAQTAYSYFLIVAPFLAAVLGGFYYLSDHVGGETAQFAAASALVGTIVSMLVLVILMTAFEPSGFSIDIMDEITGIIGIGIGSAIIGGVTGVVFEMMP